MNRSQTLARLEEGLRSFHAEIRFKPGLISTIVFLTSFFIRIQTLMFSNLRVGAKFRGDQEGKKIVK